MAQNVQNAMNMHEKAMVLASDTVPAPVEVSPLPPRDLLLGRLLPCHLAGGPGAIPAAGDGRGFRAGGVRRGPRGGRKRLVSPRFWM